jgi:hypothetical protein
MEALRMNNITMKRSHDIIEISDDENTDRDVDVAMSYNYILQLDEDGNTALGSDDIYVLPKFTNLTIKFFNGTRLAKDVKLATNAYSDITLADIFKEMTKSEEDKMIIIRPCKIDSCVYFNLRMIKPGPIFFIFYNDDIVKKEFYILVEPKSVENISLQTVLSKSLGKMKEWNNYFAEAASLSKKN